MSDVVDLGVESNTVRPPVPHDPQVVELLKFFRPRIVGGTFKESGAWAKFYQLTPQQYHLVSSPKQLNGLSPNSDVVVLVGTFRQDQSWEMAETVQHLTSVGVRVIHGGLWE